MEGQHVPAGTARGLGEIEILLVAGKSMKQKERGVRPCARSEIKDRVHSASVRGEDEGFHRRRMGPVRWRVGDDGRRDRRVERRSCKRGREKEWCHDLVPLVQTDA